MAKIENLLETEIQDEFEKLSEIKEVGSDQHIKAVEGVAKLLDRAIELDKLDYERKEKKLQMEEDKKDRLIKNCLTAAGIVIPSVITIWGTLKSLRFEQEGTVTTIIGRGFINKLLPKK